MGLAKRKMSTSLRKVKDLTGWEESEVKSMEHPVFFHGTFQFHLPYVHHNLPSNSKLRSHWTIICSSEPLLRLFLLLGYAW